MPRAFNTPRCRNLGFSMKPSLRVLRHGCPFVSWGAAMRRQWWRSMSAFCPCCGFNLTADAPVTIGRWTVSVDEVQLDGARLHLTGCEMRLLHSVAAMAPAPVRRSAVRERLSDADSADNIVSVMICRLRRKLGADMPIETVRGVGLRWIDSAIGDAA